MDDVHRLRDRVLKLQQHFGQANKDVEMVLTSSEKITSRGRKIETLDFDEETKAQEQARPKMPASARKKTKVATKTNGNGKQTGLIAGE